MKTADYTDAEGKTWRVELPDGADDALAPLGVPVGPPDLSTLGLPREVTLRLHNGLHARGIFSYRDAQRRIGEVVAALQRAYAVDAQVVLEAYRAQEVTK